MAPRPLLQQLRPRDVDLAKRLGEQAAERWRGVPGDHDDRVYLHRIEKLGQCACAQALHERDVDCEEVFLDLSRANEPPIRAGAWRIEVKTWDAASWPQAGRSVRAAQIGKLRRLADLVVWARLPERPSAGQVVLEGWSYVEDIARAPLHSARHADGHAAHHLEAVDLRDIHDLPSTLARRAPLDI